MIESGPGQPEQPTPERTSRDSEDLARWKEHLDELPDLRLAKVMRLRRALASGSYDEEQALNRMLGRIENDLGVLCRGDADLEC